MYKNLDNLKRKYYAQDRVLDSGDLEFLDERILYDILKSMLLYTSKDCIEFENWMDPSLSEINKLLNKKEKNKEDLTKIKTEQTGLKDILKCSEIAEGSLLNLISCILYNDFFQYALRKDIPALLSEAFRILDMQDDIAEDSAYYIAELSYIPSYEEICNIINWKIEDYIDNAEKIYDFEDENIEDNEYYNDFVKAREKYHNEKAKEDKDE